MEIEGQRLGESQHPMEELSSRLFASNVQELQFIFATLFGKVWMDWPYVTGDVSR